MATDLMDRPDEVPGADPSPVTPRRRRHRLAAIAAVAVVAAAGVSAAVAGRDAAGGRVAVEGPAPAFDLARVGAADDRVTLAEFAGQPVVVNFWASWCVPCRREMPALEATAERMAGRVGFVGVNYQDGATPAAGFQQRAGVRYPSGSDPDGAVGQAYGVLGLPTTVLVDPSGRIVARRLGEVTEAELVDLIDRAFGQGSDGGNR